MSSGSEQELAKARFVIDVQAKLQTLLETLSESAELRRRSRWPRLAGLSRHVGGHVHHPVGCHRLTIPKTSDIRRN